MTRDRLVARLLFGTELRSHAALVELCEEAADEIKRLRADYSILKGDYDALREELAALQASSGYEASIAQVGIERLRAALDDCVYGRKDWMEKARRALEPKP